MPRAIGTRVRAGVRLVVVTPLSGSDLPPPIEWTAVIARIIHDEEQARLSRQHDLVASFGVCARVAPVYVCAFQSRVGVIGLGTRRHARSRSVDSKRGRGRCGPVPYPTTTVRLSVSQSVSQSHRESKNNQHTSFEHKHYYTRRTDKRFPSSSDPSVSPILNT